MGDDLNVGQDKLFITCRTGKEYGRKQRKLIPQNDTNIMNDGTSC
jgi:hypothetical protein